MLESSYQRSLTPSLVRLKVGLEMDSQPFGSAVEINCNVSTRTFDAGAAPLIATRNQSDC